jgi:hypothetical protein
MTVRVNATNKFDVGYYPIRIALSDGVVTGRPGSDITWIGNSTYYLTLSITLKPGINYETPPDVRLEQVFDKYNTSVIDVRTFDRNSMLNALDTTVVVIPQPKFADPETKIVEIKKDESKQGATNATVP